MIIPASADLTAYRNSFFQVDITLQDNGGVLDITGWGALMQVRTAPGALGSPLLAIATSGVTPNGSTITFPNAASGMVRFVIQPADFADFPDNRSWQQPSAYAYDLLMIPPSTYPDVYLNGQFLLNEGVTRQ